MKINKTHAHGCGAVNLAMSHTLGGSKLLFQDLWKLDWHICVIALMLLADLQDLYWQCQVLTVRPGRLLAESSIGHAPMLEPQYFFCLIISLGIPNMASHPSEHVPILKNNTKRENQYIKKTKAQITRILDHSKLSYKTEKDKKEANKVVNSVECMILEARLR